MHWRQEVRWCAEVCRLQNRCGLRKPPGRRVQGELLRHLDSPMPRARRSAANEVLGGRQRQVQSWGVCRLHRRKRLSRTRLCLQPMHEVARLWRQCCRPRGTMRRRQQQRQRRLHERVQDKHLRRPPLESGTWQSRSLRHRRPQYVLRRAPLGSVVMRRIVPATLRLHALHSTREQQYERLSER